MIATTSQREFSPPSLPSATALRGARTRRRGGRARAFPRRQLGALALGWGARVSTGLAAGASLAPTSLGFSAQLLLEAGKLDTPPGRLICTAAVFDDVLSLVLLAEIRRARRGLDRAIRHRRRLPRSSSSSLSPRV